MAENKNMTIWIKYLNHNPVKIETHVDHLRIRREFPLTDVADLISAFQQRPGSLLANTDEGLITISTNGSLEPLRPGKLLTELSVTTDENPLIIKSRNDSLDQGLIY